MKRLSIDAGAVGWFGGGRRAPTLLLLFERGVVRQSPTSEARRQLNARPFGGRTSPGHASR